MKTSFGYLSQWIPYAHLRSATGFCPPDLTPGGTDKSDCHALSKYGLYSFNIAAQTDAVYSLYEAYKCIEASQGVAGLQKLADYDILNPDYALSSDLVDCLLAVESREKLLVARTPFLWAEYRTAENDVSGAGTTPGGEKDLCAL